MSSHAHQVRPLVPTAPFAPVGETSFRELDVATLGSLPLLIDDLQRKQNLAETALFCKQEAKDHTLPVDLDLPDITSEMPDIGVGATSITYLLHRGGDSRGIRIGELVQELLDGLATCRATVEAPLAAVVAWPALVKARVLIGISSVEPGEGVG